MDCYKDETILKSQFLGDIDCDVDRRTFVKEQILTGESDEVLSEIAQFIIEFTPTDSCMESLIDLIAFSVPKYINKVCELIYFLCRESKENFDFLMNTSLEQILCKSAGDVFPAEIEPAYLSLILFQKAISTEIINEFPLEIYEFVFLIIIKYQSDTHDSNLTKKSFVEVSKECLNIFIQIIEKKLINDEEKFNELLEQFLFFINLKNPSLLSLGIYGISKIAQQAPELASQKLLSYKIITQFSNLLEKNNPPFVQSTAMDILTSIATLDDSEVIFTMIGFGVLYRIDFDCRDKYFKESTCFLVGNLLLDKPEVIEEVIKSGILDRMRTAIDDENFNVKKAAAMTFAKLSFQDFAVEFFSEGIVLYCMLEIFPDLQPDDQEELAQSFLNLYQKALFVNADDIIVQIEADEFYESLEEAAEYSSQESFLVQLRNEISAHKETNS